MKRKIFFAVAFALLLPVAMLIAACGGNADELSFELVKNDIAVSYGNQINPAIFGVCLKDKDTTTEIYVKTDEIDGYEYEIYNIDGTKAEDDILNVGSYIVKFTYKQYSTEARLSVIQAEFSGTAPTVTLNTNSVEFLNDSQTAVVPELSVDKNTFGNKTTVEYFYQEQIDANTYSTPKAYNPQVVGNMNYFRNFQVGHYKMFAVLSGGNYKNITTDATEFEITRGTLSDKYYLDVELLTFEYYSNTLGDYPIQTKLKPTNLQKYNNYDVDLSEFLQDATFAWKYPNTNVEISNNIATVVVFDCRNFNLENNSSEVQMGVRIRKAALPNYETQIVVNGNLLENGKAKFSASGYNLSAKFLDKETNQYVDFPQDLVLQFYDAEDNVIANNLYTLSESDKQNKTFAVTYRILESDHYTQSKLYSASVAFDVFATVGDLQFISFEDALQYVNSNNLTETPVLNLYKDTTLDSSWHISKNVEINLNGHSLVSTYKFTLILANGVNVTFKNGTMHTVTNNGVTTSINVIDNSVLTLDNMTYVSNGAIVALNTASIFVQDSTMLGNTYCLSTNAETPDGYDVTIFVRNSTLVTRGYSYNEETQETDYDDVAILLNVPGTLTIQNSTICGNRQGVIVRGGSANIIDSTITCTGLNSNNDKYLSENWENGNEVPMAVLVVGNRNVKYQYPASVTLSNTALVAEGICETTIYAYGNSGDGLGATVNFNASEAELVGYSETAEDNHIVVANEYAQINIVEE